MLAPGRADAGFDRTAFAIGWDKQQATCPRGDAGTWRSPATRHGTARHGTKEEQRVAHRMPGVVPSVWSRVED
ncbi:hypothetical protein [Streptomyces sp. NPDC090445]|uniref:hypothetical protein n=1 Tax=Streptomyces sp. NPDC090445 TaxID=3365963 RepID=UPI00380D683F